MQDNAELEKAALCPVAGRNMTRTNPCRAWEIQLTTRNQESRFGSIVSVDGGIDAMRKSLYWPMNPETGFSGYLRAARCPEGKSVCGPGL